MEKKDTQKQLKLTEDQKQYIESNFYELKKIIRRKIISLILRKQLKGKVIDNINEAVSYIPTVMLEYDDKRNNKLALNEFIAYRAVLRLRDQYRKNRTSTKPPHILDLLKNIKCNLELNNILPNKENIAKEIIKLGYDPEEILNYSIAKEKYFVNYKDLVKCATFNHINDLEWLDLQDYLIKELDRKYKEDYTNLNLRQNKAFRLKKSIFKEHLLPMCNKLDLKTKGQIAEQNSVLRPRISQIIKSQEVKDLISSIYGE